MSDKSLFADVTISYIVGQTTDTSSDGSNSSDDTDARDFLVDDDSKCFSIEERNQCLYCFSEFDDAIQLQAHLATQQHPPFHEMLTRHYQATAKNRCLMCYSEVNARTETKHRCSEKLIHLLRLNEQELFEFGSPLTCILCTGTQLYSFFHLIIHTIVRHGFEGKIVPRGKNPCPLCYSRFNTDKANVIEYHAVKEHMPELYMEYLKDLQPEGNFCPSLKTSFSCKIPSKLFGIPKSVMDNRNCCGNFPSLPKYIAHLQSSHGPIPMRPLKHTLGPHTCRHCLYSFQFSAQLQDHIIRKHEFLTKQRAQYVESQDKLTKNLNDSTCMFCWHVFRTAFQLQTHIQATHLDSWRRCGLCGRDYCKFHEQRASKIVYMEMMAHERLHARQLVEHVRKMDRIVKGLDESFVETPAPEITEKYFSRINLEAARERRKIIIRDYTDIFSMIGDRNHEIQQDLLLLADL